MTTNTGTIHGIGTAFAAISASNAAPSNRPVAATRCPDGEEPADDDPGSAAQQVSRNGRRRDNQRHREARIERRRQERLQSDGSGGLEHEIEEAEEDRGLHEQRHTASQRVQMRIWRAMRCEDVPLACEDA
jgi:hypothetical protein